MRRSWIKNRVFLLCAAGLAGLIWHLAAGPDPRLSGDIDPLSSVSTGLPGDPGADFPAVHIRHNWWESAGAVYYDIPARILFQSSSAPEGSGDAPEETARGVWAELDRIGRIFNPFDPDSELSRFNRRKDLDRITVTGDMMTVLDICRQLWGESNGSFDPTAWRIKRLWMEAEKNQAIPSQTDISAVLAATGFDNIDMDDPTGARVGKTHPDVSLDFGGIIKGYAVDRATRILMEAGVQAALVQLGGEISAFGDNNGQPWRIGIQHPTDMNQLYGIISGHGPVRVSTSGNYRQPLQIEGRTFYHIFDPSTGRPAADEILGVTTADFSGAISNAVLDGAATAIVVMGRADGLALARRLGMEAMILYRMPDGSIGADQTEGLSAHYSDVDR
jgi:FAD:protein FMN transferase